MAGLDSISCKSPPTLLYVYIFILVRMIQITLREYFALRLVYWNSDLRIKTPRGLDSRKAFPCLVEAAGSASRVRRSFKQDVSERSRQFAFRPVCRLTAGCGPGQPQGNPRLPVSGHPGRNSPLHDATTPAHGAHSPEERSRPQAARCLRSESELFVGT